MEPASFQHPLSVLPGRVYLGGALSGRDIEGYEIGVQWRAPKTRLGQFTFSGETTHYLRRESQADPQTAVLDELNRNGRVAWRANASIAWRGGAWSAGDGRYTVFLSATPEPFTHAVSGLVHPVAIK